MHYPWWMWISLGRRDTQAVGDAMIRTLLSLTALTHASPSLPPSLPFSGPKFTNVIHMPVNLCLVEDAHKHIWDTTTELIDSSSCVKLGDGMELGGPDAAQYPLKYIVFYAQVRRVASDLTGLMNFWILSVALGY